MAKISGLSINGKEQLTILNGNKNNEEYELKSLLKSNGSAATDGNQTSNNESKFDYSESPKPSIKG